MPLAIEIGTELGKFNTLPLNVGEDFRMIYLGEILDMLAQVQAPHEYANHPVTL
jgi:hypothetical protein